MVWRTAAITVLALATSFPVLAGPTPDPESRLPDIPGYLGLATRSPDDATTPTFYWSPVGRNGVAVEVPAPNRTVLPKQSYLAVFPGGRAALVDRGVQTLPIGCDNTPTPMATFQSAKTLPEGPVLVTPVTTVTAEPLQPIALPEVARLLNAAQALTPATAIGWRSGTTTILMNRTDTYGYRLQIREGGRAIYEESGRKTFPFQGADRTPVTLTAPEPEVPRPVLLYRVAGRPLPSVVVLLPGYEGIGFSVLSPENGRLRKHTAGSVYLCAF